MRTPFEWVRTLKGEVNRTCSTRRPGRKRSPPGSPPPRCIPGTAGRRRPRPAAVRDDIAYPYPLPPPFPFPFPAPLGRVSCTPAARPSWTPSRTPSRILSSTRATASGPEPTSVPSSHAGQQVMPRSCRVTSPVSIPARSASDTSRDTASSSAASQPPALPIVPNTSKGRPSSSRFTVTYILPCPVRTRSVMP